MSTNEPVKPKADNTPPPTRTGGSSSGGEWYKKWWGVILAICFLPFFVTWYAWAKSSWSKNVKIGATVGSVILLFIAIGVSSNVPPTLSVDNATNNKITTNDADYTLTGTVYGADSSTTITANGVNAQINSTKYTAVVHLNEGDNTVVVTAKKNNKTVSESVVIHRTTAAETAAAKASTDKQAADNAAAEAAKNQPKTSFSDGTFLVGKDIVAGTYKTSGSDTCYYERRSDTSGDTGGVIANELAKGPTVVTIAPTDAAFKSQRCGTWVLQ